MLQRAGLCWFPTFPTFKPTGSSAAQLRSLCFEVPGRQEYCVTPNEGLTSCAHGARACLGINSSSSGSNWGAPSWGDAVLCLPRIPNHSQSPAQSHLLCFNLLLRFNLTQPPRCRTTFVQGDYNEHGFDTKGYDKDGFDKYGECDALAASLLPPTPPGTTSQLVQLNLIHPSACSCLLVLSRLPQGRPPPRWVQRRQGRVWLRRAGVGRVWLGQVWVSVCEQGSWEGAQLGKGVVRGIQPTLD